jgi:hypothetical protein
MDTLSVPGSKSETRLAIMLRVGLRHPVKE